MEVALELNYEKMNGSKELMGWGGKEEERECLCLVYLNPKQLTLKLAPCKGLIRVR